LWGDAWGLLEELVEGALLLGWGVLEVGVDALGVLEEGFLEGGVLKGLLYDEFLDVLFAVVEE
jgi:hypothetical protein